MLNFFLKKDLVEYKYFFLIKGKQAWKETAQVNRSSQHFQMLAER